MQNPWNIELLGHLQLCAIETTHTRFHSHNMASLLARLTYFPGRLLAREEVIASFWPDHALQAGRANLRNGLTALRRQLEPPGTPFGTVLIADYTYLSLNPAAFVTDVSRFEAAYSAAGKSDPVEREQALVTAHRLYRGELLPGFWEDWVLIERARLNGLYREVLSGLRDVTLERGSTVDALDYAWRVVGVDPLCEEAQEVLLKLLMESGQRDAAQKQYVQLWKDFAAQLDMEPGVRLQELAHKYHLKRHNRPIGKRKSPRPALIEESFEAEISKPDTAMHTIERPEAPLGHAAFPELPLTLTPFFGRQVEIEDVCTLLRDPQVRLLTLTGTGGIGKTRLAVEIARTHARHSTGHISFASLVDVSEPRFLIQHILKTHDLMMTGTQSPLEQLVGALRGSPHLLLLDNFEHLVAEGTSILESLFTRLPQLQCLVTSRNRLDINGERCYIVPPLPLPDPGLPLSQVRDNPAMRLLLDRAQAIRPHFQLTERNVETLSAICHKLEGLPLAIELALCHIAVVSAPQMERELQHRLDFLVTQRRHVVERHRSLRATLDWSYQLLSPREQRFFAQLSVFRGGWTAESARQVCEEPETLRLLEALHSCSLVLAEEEEDGVRFRMLETVREYGMEKLAERGEEKIAYHRYYDYFAHLPTQFGRITDLPDTLVKQWNDILEREQENLRAMLHWCHRHIELHSTGLNVLNALFLYWRRHGQLAEAKSWYTAFLPPDETKQQGPMTSTLATALHYMGNIALMQGNLPAGREWMNRSLAAAHDLDSPMLVAAPSIGLAHILMRESEYSAGCALYKECLSIHRQHGTSVDVARTLQGLAVSHYHQLQFDAAVTLAEESRMLFYQAGRYEEAANVGVEVARARYERDGGKNADEVIGACEEAIEVNRKLGNLHWTAWLLQQVGRMRRYQNNVEASRTALAEGLRLARQVADNHCILEILLNLGKLYRYERDLPASEGVLQEALLRWKEVHLSYREGVVDCLETLAGVWTQQGQPRKAVTLYGCVEVHWPVKRPVITTADRLAQEDREAACNALTRQDREAALTEGQQMPLEQAVDYALSKT